MQNISKKAIADKIGYIKDWDAIGKFMRAVVLNDKGVWEMLDQIDTRGNRLAAPTDVDIYAGDDIPRQHSTTGLMLLDDSGYTYTSETGSLSQFFESDLDGLGVVDPDDTFTTYFISLTGREIGSLTQDSEDETWTATPTTENISQKKERPTVRGFAHERYAADYLREVAVRTGRLTQEDFFDADL